jgi:hypothetical protein
VLAGPPRPDEPSSPGPVNGHAVVLVPGESGNGPFWGTFLDWQGHTMRFSSLVLLLTVLFWAGLLVVLFPRLFGAGPANDAVAERQPGEQIGPAAQVTHVRDLCWAEGASRPVGWPRLEAGDRLAVEKGLLQVTYAEGAVAVIEGPGVFVVEGRGAGKLDKGKLLVHVPPRAVGFNVRTPDTEIVDLGTGFGVTVEPEIATEVHVILGQVEVRSGNYPAQAVKAGAAVVAARGEPPVLMAARGDLFARLEPFAPALSQARSSPPQATVLLEDDFDDNSLDRAKWKTELSIPDGRAGVTEVDQHVELVNRGHLVTASQFDPTALPGGITITGQWTFAEPGDYDFIQVLTRSDGIPDPKGKGNCRNGIQFANVGDGVLNISVKGPSLSIGRVATTGTLAIAAGSVFDFTIVDDGLSLWFRMTEVGNPRNTATARATIASDSFGQNHVVFHNREYKGGNHKVFLDNVLIKTTSKPGTPQPGKHKGP